MKAHLKKQWLEALRSGEYKQVHEKLYDDVDGETGYCCLGVLATIADPEKHTWSSTDYFGGNHFACGDIHKNRVKQQVEQQIELVGEDLPVILLAKMNDDDNLNFSQIADWIEENISADD